MYKGKDECMSVGEHEDECMRRQIGCRRKIIEVFR